MPSDREYVLGTHDEELARLGLQHRVWRPVVLDCWNRAGITVGKRVLEHVIAPWRESGGEPDGAARLPELLADNGFVVGSGWPHVFCLRPNDYMWQWPATFIATYLPRLVEMGRIDQEFAKKVRADLAAAEKNPNALMLMPLVLEIIAERA